MIKKKNGPRTRSKSPELVAPAGDWPSLKGAIRHGADSVYFGVKGLNMRNLKGNFDVLELNKIMDFLRSAGKKGYLALNVLVLDKELKKAERILRKARQAGVDAVVLWDMAVLSLAKSLGLDFHISTQASVANVRAFAAYAELGAKRIILARECTLKDIKRIAAFRRENDIDCEVEAFVHGAMCISVSGRCFLSTFSSGRSANRGECLQYCRRRYLIRDESEEAEYVLGPDYVLSAKDLCTIDFLEKLIEADVDAFKIEGRRRPPEYVNTVCAAYREAIEAYYDKNLNAGLKKKLKTRLGRVFNRGFSAGFYAGTPGPADISQGLQHTHEKVFLGQVLKFIRKLNVAEIELQNGVLEKGQQLLFVGKNTPAEMATVKEIQQDHVFVEKVKKGERAGVKLPFAVRPKDKVFIWKKIG